MLLKDRTFAILDTNDLLPDEAIDIRTNDAKSTPNLAILSNLSSTDLDLSTALPYLTD